MPAASILIALTITNVTLVDGTGRAPISGVTLVVFGDRFLSVYSNAEDVKKIHAVVKAGAVIDRSALEIPANGATEP